MLRSVILSAARNRRIEHLVSTAPVSRSVVRRFLGGANTDAAVAAAGRLIAGGLTVSLDHLGEDTTDLAPCRSRDYRHTLELLTALHREGLAELVGPLTPRAEVSVKLSAVGQALPGDGEKIALEHARRICAAARARRRSGHPGHGGPHHHRLRRWRS